LTAIGVPARLDVHDCAVEPDDLLLDVVEVGVLLDHGVHTLAGGAA
jgi:hypothetical protein